MKFRKVIMERSHWSKRCCSKVFCKISTNRIGFRVGFKLGIFKPAFPPRKNAHMNHGLATMKKEIRMPFCFPHISVKKENKLALNQVFFGLCTTPGGSNYFIFLIGWLIWRHATLFLTKETDCTCGLWISCPQCAKIAEFTQPGASQAAYWCKGWRDGQTQSAVVFFCAGFSFLLLE